MNQFFLCPKIPNNASKEKAAEAAKKRKAYREDWALSTLETLFNLKFGNPGDAGEEPIGSQVTAQPADEHVPNCSK